MQRTKKQLKKLVIILVTLWIGNKLFWLALTLIIFCRVSLLPAGWYPSIIYTHLLVDDPYRTVTRYPQGSEITFIFPTFLS